MLASLCHAAHGAPHWHLPDALRLALCAALLGVAALLAAAPARGGK